MYNKLVIVLGLFMLLCTPLFAQVGIGTTTPDPSAILDVNSATGGMLTPRMTSAQRQAISDPAQGLIVFDTDQDSFYFYTGGSWDTLDSESRANHKIIKSVADLADELSAGGGSSYLLDANTLYEVNGVISLAVPIDLNNSYIFGKNSGQDRLEATGGTVFQSTKGGTVRRLTISAIGGIIYDFNASNGGALVVKDCFLNGSNSVGTVNGFDFIFFRAVIYSNNNDGITISNIDNVYVAGQGWDATNNGTYKTFSGVFNSIQKEGGFMEVSSGDGAVGIDITGITSIAGSAQLKGVNFYGGGTYVVGNSPYSGYNFTNDWYVACPGLPLETDDTATGNVNLNYPIGFGAETTFSGRGTSSRTKVVGDTDSDNLFRFTSTGDNRLIYDGTKTRFFNVTTSLSYQGDNNNAIFIFYLAKGTSGSGTATVLEKTRVYKQNNGSNDLGAVSIVGTVELSPGDYIEVWAERYSGGGDLLTVSLNMTAQ